MESVLRVSEYVHQRLREWYAREGKDLPQDRAHEVAMSKVTLYQRDEEAFKKAMRDTLGPVSKLAVKGQPAVKKEVGFRNQPCPCGSGKKYKRCCRG